jgi:hypothetical protein
MWFVPTPGPPDLVIGSLWPGSEPPRALGARTFALDAGVPPSDPAIAEAGPQPEWRLHVTLDITVQMRTPPTAANPLKHSSHPQPAVRAHQARPRSTAPYSQHLRSGLRYPTAIDHRSVLFPSTAQELAVQLTSALDYELSMERDKAEHPVPVFPFHPAATTAYQRILAILRKPALVPSDLDSIHAEFIGVFEQPHYYHGVVLWIAASQVDHWLTSQDPQTRRQSLAEACLNS